MAVTAVRAWAPVNIALVKYWGKRDIRLNLPQSSSLSATLTRLGSQAVVEAADADELICQGDPSRARRVLMAARTFARNVSPLRIAVSGNFPMGAGLASSASSMAALALALSRMIAPEAPAFEVERWARIGSGSAARSLHEGYVLWHAGVDPAGADCVAESICSADHVPLAVCVCVVDPRPKSVDSTTAMEHCRLTSPLYEDFHRLNPVELARMLLALRERDVAAMGAVAERNCLAMHEVLRSAQPPIDFLTDSTMAVVGTVRSLRASGLDCFFTIDAGPNVKVFTPPDNLLAVRSACAAVPGVLDVLADIVGPSVGARGIS